MRVLTDDNVLIGGFIITGTAPKKVIVRAIGPSLTGLGVAGALADTTLELHEPDGTVVANDDWKETQQAEIEATTIPPSDDRESAIVQTLLPGAYTAIVRGKNTTTGVGLVEAYDLDQPADSRLANISTRGFVDTADNVMIGGFIIGPADLGAATVLIRGIGPSLANAGVADPLQDPTLELHDGNGALLTSNDDWKDSQQSEIEATTIPPTDDRESAILQTLAPGNYTAIVRGKAETTGVGLVEIYHLQ
jgi:predicted methyltransferase MtxX (methanogen marker protein 4)